MQKTDFTTVCLLLIMFVFSGLGAVQAQVPANDPQAVGGDTLGPEQQRLLFALDIRLAGLEALAKLIEDPDYASDVARQIASLRRQRDELPEDDVGGDEGREVGEPPEAPAQPFTQPVEVHGCLLREALEPTPVEREREWPGRGTPPARRLGGR